MQRSRCAGVTMVEFAIVAPLFFLLVLGIIVACIIGTNQVQVNNVARDGARAAGVCGGLARVQEYPVPTLPNGHLCDVADLESYITSRFQAVPASLTLSICIGADSNGAFTDCSGTDPQVLDHCQARESIQVSVSFDQPLYAPIVGQFFSNDGTGNGRILTGTAEAACER